MLNGCYKLLIIIKASQGTQMRFVGTIDELKVKLSSLENGDWKELNPNQYQYHHESGVILNWYPSTGTINFQGKSDPSLTLKNTVEALLGIEGSSDNTSEKSVQNETKISNSNQSKEEDKNDQSEGVYCDSELIIGLVGAVGTDLDQVIKVITEKLKAFSYTSQLIKISSEIISALKPEVESQDNFERINSLMKRGNELRKNSGDNSILALSIAAKINQIRETESASAQLEPLPRKAFIISSLKHPEEVQELRKIYSSGFFLIGVYADEKRRFDYLNKNKSIKEANVQHLMERDLDETDSFGQHTRDTYHLSDFFVNFNGNSDKFINDLWRIVDLIFGKPYITPTFDEFAMFMAFTASLRSADLSRQVGAVMTKNQNIVSTGANDVPKAGGGLYWPEYNEQGIEIVDKEDGRDYKRGFDSNSMEKKAIIEDILSKIPDMEQQKLIRVALQNSKIKHITEYGRVVHAEMEAILACARSNIGTQEAELYCTTFPCHNCAKHIIASGIRRVVYVEPYPKSKAFEFHSDSISSEPNNKGNVIFEPFVGVGPRSFFNLFSTKLGGGYPIERKNVDGEIVEWHEDKARLRMQMLPTSYIERETYAASEVQDYLEKRND
jgi:deoxycytidylate deaminase